MSIIRRARQPDQPELLQLIRAFCAADHHDYDEARVAAALGPLLDTDDVGQVWLILNAGTVLGYAVVTWGYSLESGGRDALLDEIYLAERGRGLGGAALAEILLACREAGASRMFLETEAHNDAVRRFYTRHGFSTEDSIWMSREL